MIYRKRTVKMDPYECILLEEKKKSKDFSRFEFCFGSLKINNTGSGASIEWKLGQKNFYFFPTPVIGTWPK